LKAGQILSFDCPAGDLILDASCTGGEVRRRGVHTLTDNSGGAVTITMGALDRDEVEKACEQGLTDYDAATGMDVSTVEGKVDDVYTDTQRVDGLIENSVGDRFTAKALEEAPSGGGSSSLDTNVSVKPVSNSIIVTMDMAQQFVDAGGTSWATRILHVFDNEGNDVTNAILGSYTLANGIFTCNIKSGGRLPASPYQLLIAVRISAVPSLWISKARQIYLEAR